MVYDKDSNIVTRRIADETLLIPVRGHLADLQRLFVLEGIGEYVWERLDGKSSVGEIIDAIVEDFDVTREEADRDLQEFIHRLKDAGLVLEAEVP
jgi:hypothetical protein